MIEPVRLLACVAFAGIAGCAAPQTSSYASAPQSRGPACFRANEVTGYTPGPDGFVEVATAEGPFRLRLGPGCPDFSWIMEVGVRPMESSWLCEGKADELITAAPPPAHRCTVSEIESLDDRPLSQG